MTDFESLGLAEPILRALREEGYSIPTPIQLQAIPPVLAGSDILGIAQTGTGKTAAFALPILHRLAADRRPAPRRGCRVLVLSPTRELATQIGDSFRTYGRHLQLHVAVVFGGVAHRPQIQALARGVDILVATPGRLLDHVGERNAELQGVEILVLDEADQMLDLGFVKPIRRIVSLLTAKRQTLFFSATMPHEIAALAGEFLRDPVKIAVTPGGSTVDRVRQRVILVEAKRKRAMLTELFTDPDLTRTLVFTRTKRGADKVAKHLETGGISAAAIHGNKSQKQREVALDAFRKGQIRVLVATDIAARGIDIDSVSHVVNFELPEVPESYVHRIGRTARAGAHGSAISLCAPDERDLLRRIEQLTRRTITADDRMRDAYLEADTDPIPSRAADRRNRGGRRNDESGHRHQSGRSGSRERRHNDEPRREGRPADAGRDHPHARADDRRGEGPSRRPERHNGEARSDARPAEFNRDRGGDRPNDRRGSDRPFRSDRPHRPDRHNGEARSDARTGDFNRDRGGDRPSDQRGSDRPFRSERPHRPERANGEARSGARPGGFNRDRGGDRANDQRGSDRPFRSDRPHRADRPNGEARGDARPGGFNRDRGGDRPKDQSRSDRPHNSERHERSGRSERPHRSDRPQSAQHSESGPRDHRPAGSSPRPAGSGRPRRFSRPREGGREQQG